MNKRGKLYIILFATLIVLLIVLVVATVLSNTPKKDKQGRTLIGIDDPSYDPKKDPNNPFNDDYRDKDGNYFYENRDLGFNITLPPEFIYFQTQRWNNTSFSDLEILVPTNDPAYTHATPPSYAKPIIVRIWKDMDDWNEEDKNEYVVFGEKNGKVYTLKFWDTPTKDWTEKWTSEMEVFIGQNINML